MPDEPVKDTTQTWVPADMDDATKGHVQTRGWDKLPADKAVLEAVKAHREATTFIGHPQDRLLKLPAANADPKEWDPIYQRLGAPKDVAEYGKTLDAVKFKNGDKLDDATRTTLTGLATKNHWTPAALTDAANAMVARTEADEAKSSKSSADEIALADKRLRDNWGANYEPFKIVAKRAAERLGPEFVKAAEDLEKSAGYDKAMELFRMLGVQFGEDTFIRNSNGGKGMALTKEQAVARLAELRGDTAWTARHIKGDPETRKEHDALIAISLG